MNTLGFRCGREKEKLKTQLPSEVFSTVNCHVIKYCAYFFNILKSKVKNIFQILISENNNF